MARPTFPRVLALAACLLALALAAAPAAATASKPAPWTPTWLCKPGLAGDPCTPGLSTTLFSPTLSPLGVTHPRAVAHPPIDCFYVYPTVSDQPTGNASLRIDPEERSIALYQAARYSQYCRVYAPAYRQVTLAGIGLGKPTTPVDQMLPLADVRAAFAYYLRHFNHGRGFVLIGHSQGAFVLRALIAKDVDPHRAVRSHLLSAILLGGDVLVRPGRAGMGGDFKHIGACRSSRQLHCVIAFSTFNQPVPSTSIFGRAPKGSKDIVLCTNPAALGGGSGIADTILPSQPFAPGTLIAAGIAVLHLTQPHPSTVWIEQRNAYRLRCVASNGAHVLFAGALHRAQVANPSPDATWGLHLLDANIALGNLLAIVRAESRAYLR
jgi:hypothetical protein